MTELKSSTRTRSILLIVFGAGWTVAASAFVYSPVTTLLTQPPVAELEWILLPLLLLPAVGLALMAIGLYPWIAGLRVSRPEIVIDKATLGVGDTFTIGFSQTFKGRSEVRGIQLSLVMREAAHHQVGRNSHTYHHEDVIAQFDRPGQTFEAGETLAFSQPVSIPKSGMHTFHAMNNSIDWDLRVQVDVAGWPDYQDSFDLQVLPAPIP